MDGEGGRKRDEECWRKRLAEGGRHAQHSSLTLRANCELNFVRLAYTRALNICRPLLPYM